MNMADLGTIYFQNFKFRAISYFIFKTRIWGRGRREEGGLAKQNSSARMRLSCHYAVLKSLKVLMLIGVLWGSIPALI